MQQGFVCVGLALALAAAGAPGLAQNQPAAQAPAPQTLAPQTLAPQAPTAAPPEATKSAPASAPASTQRYSVDSKFSDLLADPKAADVVRAFFRKRRAAAGKPDPSPDEEAHTIELIRDMTPREVSRIPPGRHGRRGPGRAGLRAGQGPGACPNAAPAPTEAAAPTPVQAAASAGDPSPK